MSGEIFCTYVTKSIVFRTVYRGANCIDNDNLFYCDFLSRFQVVNRTGWFNRRIVRFVMTRFITQIFRYFIQRVEVLILLCYIEVFCVIEGVQLAERVVVERREVQVVDQRYIRFRRSGDNVFFQIAYYFVDYRDYYAGDNFFFVEIAFRLVYFCQQVFNGGVFFFFRFIFVVFFITLEIEVVFLIKAVGIKQRVDGIAVIFLYSLREVCCYDSLSVMRGINVYNVQQICRVYRLVKLFFYYFVDFAEIRVVAQQLVEIGEIREQYAVNKEVGVVVNYNRRFVYFVRLGDNFRDGFVGVFFVANNFY